MGSCTLGHRLVESFGPVHIYVCHLLYNITFVLREYYQIISYTNCNQYFKPNAPVVNATAHVVFASLLHYCATFIGGSCRLLQG